MNFHRNMAIASILVSICFGVLLILQTNDLRKLQRTWDAFTASTNCAKYQMLCTLQTNNQLLDQAIIDNGYFARVPKR